MKLIPRLQNFKATIIFIHGFRKNSSQWNYSESGNALLIEETLSKIANTILIDLTDEDYIQDTTTVVEEMYRQLSSLQIITTKIILVAHSQASFYCLRLSEMYPTIFARLLLLDPSIKNQAYLNLLESKVSKNPGDIVERAKLQHFEDLPTCDHIKNSVIIRVHLNISSPADLMDNIIELNKLTNKNTKSRLVVHYDVSHMIHYRIPHVIIDAIKELAKI